MRSISSIRRACRLIVLFLFFQAVGFGGGPVTVPVRPAAAAYAAGDGSQAPDFASLFSADLDIIPPAAAYVASAPVGFVVVPVPWLVPRPCAGCDRLVFSGLSPPRRFS